MKPPFFADNNNNNDDNDMSSSVDVWALDDENVSVIIMSLLIHQEPGFGGDHRWDWLTNDSSQI